MFQVLPAEFRVEAIKACRHCRVGGKHVAGPGNRQCEVKGDMMIRHIAAGAFKHGKRCMSFVEMANFRIQADLAQ